ncbi:MAG TPA: efflux RND transporter periplasmic adaptor subunit [Steroidobacteraceae bacterium]
MKTPANRETALPEGGEEIVRPQREHAGLAQVRPFPRVIGAEPGAADAQTALADMDEWPIKRLLIGFAAVLVAVGVWVATRDSAAPVSTPAQSPVTPIELATVDIETVTPRSLARSLPLSGSLSPIVQATVEAEVAGEVEEVTLREGQDVREGEVIARLDTRNLQAQYDRELAAVEKARADLELATLNRDKNRTLLEQRYISRNTYEQTESAYARSVAELKLAEAQARLAKLGLEEAVIRAPFSGTIAKRLVQPGEKVSPDSGIVTLVDLTQMVLEAAIPAADIPSVRPGQKVRFTVNGFGEREFEGEVQRINPVTTDGSRAIAVYIAVPNPDRALKGGMFAKGELTVEASEPVLAVAQRAVHEDGGVHFVYLLRDEKIARAPVTLGQPVKGSAYVEVREGLKPGDRVITTQIIAAQVGKPAIVRGEEVAGASATSELAGRP